MVRIGSHASRGWDAGVRQPVTRILDFSIL